MTQGKNDPKQPVSKGAKWTSGGTGLSGIDRDPRSVIDGSVRSGVSVVAGVETSRRWRLAQGLALLISIYVVFQGVEVVLRVSGHRPGLGTLGGTWAAPSKGCQTVSAVDPGSPAARAGIAVGDRICFEPAWVPLRQLVAGEHVSAKVRRGTSGRSVVLTAAPSSSKMDLGELRYASAELICALLGAFILLRSRAQPAAVLLGAGLVFFGRAYVTPEVLEGGAHTFLAAYAFDLFLNAATYPAFLAFAVVLFERAAGKRAIGGWAICGLLLAATTAAYAVGYLVSTLAGQNSFTERPVVYAHVGEEIAMALTAVYLFRTRRRTPAIERQRYTLMLLALACIFSSQTATNWLSLNPQSEASVAASPLQAIGDLLAGVVAPALFAYAILRHKVLDLGFALNRTLIYGVVSAVLLAAFGLIEWAVEHFVPIEGREKNAIVDAAIALGVFLTFHRVRDVVEHGVEGLFFRRWQEQEAALRKFVREARFITTSEALLNTAVTALSRFSDGADVALYLDADQGCLIRVAASGRAAPDRLDPNDPAIVTLRAERKPLEIEGSGSGLPAVLAAPMVDRHEVGGVVLLGPKPSGAGYRPDEIDLLAWAATQIGLDFLALDKEQLQLEKDRLLSEVLGWRRKAEDLEGILTKAVASQPA